MPHLASTRDDIFVNGCQEECHMVELDVRLFGLLMARALVAL